MSNVLDLNDSFDSYGTSQLLTSGWNGGAINTTAGRRGGGGYQPGTSNATIKGLRTNYQTLLLQGACFNASYPPNGNFLMGFKDAGSMQFDVETNDGTGGVRLTRNGTTVGTIPATGLLTPGVYHFMELRVTFATGTSGTAELKIDGVSVILASGVNTSATGNAFANQVYLSGGMTWDDVAVYGGNSGTVPAYVGDLAVKAFAPTADGFHLDGTPNSGSPHWSRTSEIPPDGDTSYNSLSTPGQIDGATFATVGAGTVYGVQHRVTARYDDAGPHTIASVVRIASTDYTSAAVALSNTYQTFAFIWETSPATGIAWTVSELNGAEWDTKLVT